MIRKILALVLLMFAFFPRDVLAVDFTISNYPSEINTDEFTVDLNIQYASSTNTTNYVSIDLYKDGVTNKQFGDSYNGTSWYRGGVGTNYLKVDVVNGTASAQLKARVGSPDSSYYPGSGTYKLKARRYTSETSYSSSDAVDVNITLNLSTPTPAPTDSPTSSPTTTPTKSPTPKPTVKATSTSKPKTNNNENSEQQVLGLREQLETPTPSPEAEEGDKTKPSWGAYVFVILGLGFIGVAGYSFYIQKKGYTKDYGNEQKDSQIP